MAFEKFEKDIQEAKHNILWFERLENLSKRQTIGQQINLLINVKLDASKDFLKPSELAKSS